MFFLQAKKPKLSKERIRPALMIDAVHFENSPPAEPFAQEAS
jgi:hypothetical protein